MIPAADHWPADDIPGQLGRTAVITGANSGIGLVVATLLAKSGATVVLACRDVAKAERAAAEIRACSAQSSVRTVRLDLASLTSVREAARELKAAYPRVDLLINNAGVMWPPFQRSADGFELTFATNHLGHFAFTGLVLDSLVRTPGSRVITVSSVVHRDGVMRFDDLQSGLRYRPADAYAQSKLANLLFTYELSDRLRAAGHATAALAAHPGIARTELFRWNPPLTRILLHPALRPAMFWMVQSPQQGALSILRAAVDPSARSGEYYGPGGWRGYRGPPVLTTSASHSHEVPARRLLWERSEALTGVSYLSLRSQRRQPPAPPNYSARSEGFGS